MTNQETGDLIFATAFADGMPANMCRLIEAQSRHETGNYKSNAFLTNKNCFGYKVFKGSKWQQGAGITSSEGDPYAKYATVEDSVHELCAWIHRRQLGTQFPADLTTIKTPADYAQLLKKCGYFGDTVGHYTSGLTHFLSQNV
jgi:hypothetical protein